MRFPNLCLLAVPKSSNGGNTDDKQREPIGCVVGKIDFEEEGYSNMHAPGEEGKTYPTGYIGMLAVSKDYRRRGIGKALVQRVVHRMKKMGCRSVTLETEGKVLKYMSGEKIGLTCSVCLLLELPLPQSYFQFCMFSQQPLVLYSFKRYRTATLSRFVWFHKGRALG